MKRLKLSREAMGYEGGLHLAAEVDKAPKPRGAGGKVIEDGEGTKLNLRS